MKEEEKKTRARTQQQQLQWNCYKILVNSLCFVTYNSQSIYCSLAKIPIWKFLGKENMATQLFRWVVLKNIFIQHQQQKQLKSNQCMYTHTKVGAEFSFSPESSLLLLYFFSIIIVFCFLGFLILAKFSWKSILKCVTGNKTSLAFIWSAMKFLCSTSNALSNT